jgi:hypothetical protein
MVAISLDRPQTTMKCPVYRKIELTVAPDILNLPLKFIKSLIKLFPTADDLRILTLDTDDTGEDIQGDDVLAEKVDTESHEQNIFCQEFIFNQFDAQLSLRRKEKGLLAEFNNLALHYKGIHVYDVSGHPSDSRSSPSITSKQQS